MKLFEEDMTSVFRALKFAALKHRGQQRKDREASPYINHPIAVAEVLWEVGRVREPTTLVAGILHDTLEDTRTTVEELRELFGDQAAAVVSELTDDKSLEKGERKRLQIEHAAHISPAARQVKLADKICNVTDILESPPESWSPERKLGYVEWAEKVVERLRGTNEFMEERFRRLCEEARRRMGNP